MFRRKLIRVASAILMILALTLPLAAPAAAVATVTSVVPNFGGSGGGKSVVINGTDFLPGTCTSAQMIPVTTVMFDTAVATVTAMNDTTITVNTPPHAAVTPGGTVVSVSVQQGVPAGACTAAGSTGPVTVTNAFTYFNPSLNSVGPSSGPPGTTLSLLGNNLEGTTSVRFALLPNATPCAPATSTAATATVVNSNQLTVVAPTSLAAGTYVLCVVNAQGTFVQDVSFSTTAVATVTPAVTPFPTPIGGFDLTVNVRVSPLIPLNAVGGGCGQIVGDAPGFLLSPAPAPGSPLNRVNVVAVNINDANSARVAVTGELGTAGQAVFRGLTPGIYRVTTADNSNDYIPVDIVTGTPPNTTVVSAASSPAGHLIDTRVVTLPLRDPLNVDLTCKTSGIAPAIGEQENGQIVANIAGTSTVFGYLVDWFTGLPIPGATILVNQNVNATGAGNPDQANPQAGTQLASVLTDANGRFETLEIPSGPVVVRVAPALGLNCVVQRADIVTLIPNELGLPNQGIGPQITPSINTCTDAMQLRPGRSHDPAFIGASAGAGVAGTMQGVIPMVYRDADITRTGGIRIETTMVRLSNAGPMRTVACIDWHNSDSNGTRIGTERDCLDLAAGAVGIFTNIGDLIPAGIMGMAEFFSIDQDGPSLGSVDPGQPGTIYGISDLQATVSYTVREAGNAIAGNNALSAEDLTISGGDANTAGGIATVFKNYSGTAHRHSSVVQACNTTGVPVRQPVVFSFFGITGQRGATGASEGIHTLSADPGGCVSFNMNDITFLRDGTYAVRIISTGLQTPPLQNFLFPGRINDFGQFDDQRIYRPSSFFATSITYSRTGNMANSLHGYRATNSAGGTAPGLQFGQLFGALVFNDYNGWNTGISVANFASYGDGGTATVNLTFYDESSRVVGTIGDSVGGESARTFYLPALPFQLPPGFKGMVVVQGVPAEFSDESGLQAYANHVNYARNHNISYMFTTDEYLRAPPAPDSRPCVGLGRFTGGNVQFLQNIQSCLWVTEAVKQAPGGIPNGPTTGVRLFNPTNEIAEVELVYYDSAGFEWVDGRTLFNIPAFTQATIFLGTERRLPEVWSGQIYVKSSKPIVGVANVVNYGVTGRDESRAFNLPNQSGKTQ
jgi:hypothetical protein